MEPREFFETLESLDPSKTAGMNNSYVFEIEDTGTWQVDVADGTVKVTEGGTEGDVTIRSSEETFKAILTREQNPTTAYMTGKIKIDGDMSAALKLQKLF